MTYAMIIKLARQSLSGLKIQPLRLAKAVRSHAVSHNCRFAVIGPRTGKLTECGCLPRVARVLQKWIEAKPLKIIARGKTAAAEHGRVDIHKLDERITSAWLGTRD